MDNLSPPEMNHEDTKDTKERLLQYALFVSFVSLWLILP